MNTFTQVLIAIAFVLVVMFIFNVYAQFLSKLSLNGVKKRIAKGKVTDKQLALFYRQYDKGRKKKWTAIFMYGIFYKSFLQMQDATFQVYKEEMEKRGLLNQVG